MTTLETNFANEVFTEQFRDEYQRAVHKKTLNKVKRVCGIE